MSNGTPRRSAVQAPDETDPESTAAIEPVVPPPPETEQRAESPRGEAEPRGRGRDAEPDGRARSDGMRNGWLRLGSAAGPSVLEREAELAQTVGVASFPTYQGASDAIARLGGTGFPIDQITIVGCDLRLVEEITGRMTLPRAAALGAVSGAWFGALVSALVGIFAGSFGAFLALLLWGIILGAVFGTGLGMLAFITIGRNRGFTSDRLVIAGRYDLHAPPELADRLRTEVLTHRPSEVSIIDGRPMR
ncbi:MAG: general stress protein [Micromonosporaceae bacterium]